MPFHTASEAGIQKTLIFLGSRPCPRFPEGRLCTGTTIMVIQSILGRELAVDWFGMGAYVPRAPIPAGDQTVPPVNRRIDADAGWLESSSKTRPLARIAQRERPSVKSYGADNDNDDQTGKVQKIPAHQFAR
jgi:hypothetical protein